MGNAPEAVNCQAEMPTSCCMTEIETRALTKVVGIDVGRFDGCELGRMLG